MITILLSNIKKHQLKEDHMMQCRICKKISLRRFGGRHKGTVRMIWYAEKTKARWNGRTCPKCQQTINDRNDGHVPMAECQSYSQKLGRENENLVADLFRSMGYDIEQTTNMGPDLTLFKHGLRVATCEVKTVSVSKKKHHEHRIPRIYKARLNDDLIAMVFPDKGIYIEKMKDHLINCTKDFSRTLRQRQGEHLLRGVFL